MKYKGMGRTRLGRLAALTVPATALSLGFGIAIAQGAVSASLSAADPFQVTADTADATGLELSLRPASVATSNSDATATDKKAALVSLKNGSVNNLCLAANQPVPVFGNIGLTLSVAGDVSLGSNVDINADAVGAAGATLPRTEIGIAQSELTQGTGTGYQAGGFGLKAGKETGQTVGDVNLTGLDADAYALTLDNGLTTGGLTIAPVLGTATCS